MDYCDPCRRHLNGALACPGCGTSADALRWREPEYGGYDAVPEGGAGGEGVPDVHEVHDVRDGSGEPDEADSHHGEHGDDGAPLGRAARRRGRGRGREHEPVGEGPGEGPAVGRAGGTGRPRRIAGGGAGRCSSRRGSCWRRVG
ncbi:SCO2400 family protein [Streptomyces afghaniensis]|uniref:SCO2400 family protein n=1 Tax=Streptomyces afghaniensis TaxID=66865 RepID=UPI003CC846E1